MPDIELYLIRHAESVANTQPHIIGGRSSNSPITEKGVEQAKRLGEHFLNEGIIPAEVLASPAVRTRQTAHHTLQTMGVDLEPKIDDDLQELDQGHWAGEVRLEKYNDATLQEIKRLGKDFKPPGGESMNEGGDRILGCIERNIDTTEPVTDTKCVFAFSHGMITRCLASTIHDWSQAMTFEKSTDNTSYSLFVYRGGMWQLEYLGKKPE